MVFSLHFVGPDGKENLFTSLVGDQFLHPCDLNVSFRGDIVRRTRCQSLLGIKGLKGPIFHF